MAKGDLSRLHFICAVAANFGKNWKKRFSSTAILQILFFAKSLIECHGTKLSTSDLRMELGLGV